MNNTAMHWLDSISVARALIFLAAAFGIFGVFLRFLPRTRKFFRVLDTLFGDPDSKDPAKQGIIKVLETHGILLQQLTNNGGSSVKDKVDKTHSTVTELSRNMKTVTEKVEQHLITSNQYMASELIDRENVWTAIHALQKKTFPPHQIEGNENEEV